MIGQVDKASRQRGVTLFGLMFWAVIVGFVALIGMRVLPAVNEYFTIKRAVNKIAARATQGHRRSPRSAPRSRSRRTSNTRSPPSRGKDLIITKENDKVVVSFAYDKEVELVKPVFLLIKFEGRSN